MPMGVVNTNAEPGHFSANSRRASSCRSCCVMSTVRTGQVLVTPHLFATPGHSSPLLHLRRLGPNGMFARFASHFDQLRSHCAPVGQDQRESSHQLS